MVICYLTNRVVNDIIVNVGDAICVLMPKALKNN